MEGYFRTGSGPNCVDGNLKSQDSSNIPPDLQSSSTITMAFSTGMSVLPNQIQRNKFLSAGPQFVVNCMESCKKLSTLTPERIGPVTSADPNLCNL